MQLVLGAGVGGRRVEIPGFFHPSILLSPAHASLTLKPSEKPVVMGVVRMYFSGAEWAIDRSAKDKGWHRRGSHTGPA